MSPGELLNSINSLASSGLTFAEIERHLAQKYYDWHWANEEKFHEHQRHCVHKEKKGSNSGAGDVTMNDTFPDPKEWIELPSDDIIINYFELNFREFELFYIQKMSELSALHLSADHTFKVAANIGIHLENKK